MWILLDADHVVDTKFAVDELEVTEVNGTKSSVTVLVDSLKRMKTSERLRQHLSLDAFSMPHHVVN